MKIITLAFILIFALSAPAQNLNFDNMDSAKILSLLQSENLDSKNTISEPNIVSKILQIGDKNIVDVTLYPDNKLNSTQIGDYNTLIYQVAIFMLTIVRQMWYNNIVVIMVGKN